MSIIEHVPYAYQYQPDWRHSTNEKHACYVVMRIKMSSFVTSKITIYSHPTKDFLESRSDILGSHFFASETKTMAYNMAAIKKGFSASDLLFTSQFQMTCDPFAIKGGDSTTWMKFSPSLITTHRFLGPPLELWINWKSSIKHNFWINKLSKPVFEAVEDIKT